MFVVVAYRWGWTNFGWYIHDAFTDLNDAVNSADEECQGRGGKYGVAVEKTPHGEIAAYFPSSYGEAGPHCNRRIAVAEHIGLDVLNAVQDGEAMLPVDGTDFLRATKVEAPQWMHERVKHYEEIEAIFERDLPAQSQAEGRG